MQQLCIRTDGSLVLLIIGGVYQGDFDSKPGEPLCEEFRGTAVDVTLGD